MYNCILASTSTLHGGTFLDYLIPDLADLFKDVDQILFVPYARPGGISHQAYTDYVAKRFEKFGKKVVGIHEFDNPAQAITDCSAVFIGGGNTFLLVAELYKHDLLLPLKEKLQLGMPYLGTSAGSNICGLTMQTTNDMPIVYPPSFKTLGILPFNLNPHYLDPDPNSLHMGETRETRIHEFHTLNTVPVVGLREGSWIHVTQRKAILKGIHTARLFKPKASPIEIETGTDINMLILPNRKTY